MPASPVLWLQQQRRLLELEYEYEKTQFRTQTEIAGITRKIKQGYVGTRFPLERVITTRSNQTG